MTIINTRPLRIYLDSSDYSILSNGRKSAETSEVRAELQRLADSGQVEFWYSAASISEMAPIKWEHGGAAAGRAACLSDLCQRHALISMNRLLTHEYACLVQGQHISEPVYSYDGNWFPDISGIMPKPEWASVLQSSTDLLKSQGMNRAMRRKVKETLIRHQKPRKEYLAHMSENSDVSEIIDKYPMREQDALVLRKYLLGQATKSEAEIAFSESLRDPRWMMQWFDLHYDKMSTIQSWVRGDASKMIDVVRTAATAVSELFERIRLAQEQAKLLEIPCKLEKLDDAWWKSAEEGVVSNTITKVSRVYGDVVFESLSSVSADKFMRGFSTCIRTLFSLVRHSVGSRARKPKESDWGDCIHSLYAPYVDIFRTDSFMASVIQRHVDKYGVTVVGRPQNLLEAIRKRIAN